LTQPPILACDWSIGKIVTSIDVNLIYPPTVQWFVALVIFSEITGNEGAGYANLNKVISGPVY
jgi:hypothetical protein